MKRIIKRIAQAPPPEPSVAPPMPPADPLGGLGGLGGGGLGAMPPASPAGAPPAGAPSSDIPQKILYPLENSGMILQDSELQKRLKEQFASTDNINTTSEQEIANEIWMEYGGNKLGGVDKEKVGKRLPEKEVDQEEIERTKNRKWERLVSGKNLDDMGITLKDITTMVAQISRSMAELKKKESGAGGGGGIMAASKDDIIRLAKDYYHKTAMDSIK